MNEHTIWIEFSTDDIGIYILLVKKSKASIYRIEQANLATITIACWADFRKRARHVYIVHCRNAEQYLDFDMLSFIVNAKHSGNKTASVHR